MKKISIIVPVYNAEKYLHRCIDSILNQTLDDFELILVNDGSKDSSGAICEEYAKKDGRIVVIHKENGGVSSARNVGVEAATGEFIAFVDSDDEVLQDFFLSAVSKIDGFDLYICGFKEILVKNGKMVECDYKIQTSKKMNITELYSKYDEEFPVLLLHSPFCKLYRNEIIKTNEITFDSKLNLGEDLLFNIQYGEKINNVYFDENIYYLYHRENESSLSVKFYPSFYDWTIKIYDKWRDVIIAKGVDHEGLSKFENMYLSKMIGNIAHFYGHERSKAEKKDIIERVINNEWVRNNRSYKGKLKSRVIGYFIRKRKKRIVKFIFDLAYMLKK